MSIVLVGNSRVSLLQEDTLILKMKTNQIDLHIKLSKVFKPFCLVLNLKNWYY